MAHPDGGRGNIFDVTSTFQEAFNAIGTNGIEFQSTTGNPIQAIRGQARSGVNTIEFRELNHPNQIMAANVCEQCWGFRQNCNGNNEGTRVGQYVEGLDRRLNENQ